MTLNNVVMPIRPSSNITMVPGFNLKIAEIWVLNSKPTFNLTFRDPRMARRTRQYLLLSISITT